MDEPSVDVLRESFSGRSVLLTGHTGFKGSWLAIWLQLLGAHVTGYALDPPTQPGNYQLAEVGQMIDADIRGDIRDRKKFADVVRAADPDVVLHLAAQTVVLDSYADPLESFDVNVVGTASVLDGVGTLGKPCAVVVVTSDKCYANDESGRRFTEDDPLGGHDPYSASKAGQELVVSSYRDSFFAPERLAHHGVALSSARAGNVIGGGDWTPHGVIADIVRTLGAGEAVGLRRPDAIRPWQHVLEPLSGYLTLAARLLSANPEPYCGAWNFGPRPEDEATVAELTDAMIEAWGGGRWVDNSRPDDLPEAGVLRLSTEHTADALDWRPRWGLSDAVRHTVGWYRRLADDPTSARAACISDIEAYMTAGAAR
ncbi:CDP-glucose 4,6-dehydratase [Gordonia bronchialis]|uniref:CDP-glucose 4,6-dehydratase n=1 Tax=Gordonia bronchialis TaxID=2054 RepID=UPI0022712BF0|nr:CDP-glucose 4,6-dehydratase [Gordonia bronchialis]